MERSRPGHRVAAGSARSLRKRRTSIASARPAARATLFLMTPTRILVIGKNGQVGWELLRTLAPLGEVHATGRHELDLANPDSVRQSVRAIRPQIIISAGAYTAVDQAESEPDFARSINALAPGI